jgi:hypothetical protein
MDLLVQIRWVNGGSPNLPASLGNNVAHAPGTTNVAANRSDIDIQVTGDGGPGVPQSGSASTSGVDYLVSNVGQNLSVSVTFWLTVPKPAGSQATAFRGPTLKIDQTFTVAPAGIAPKSATLPQGGSVTTHPLLQVSAGSALANGTQVAVVNIDTTFVDVTDHWAAWMTMSGCKEWTIYNQLHASGTKLAVLAYTTPCDPNPFSSDTRGPTFWFVSIPDSCVSASGGTNIAHVVYFKPDVGFNTNVLNNFQHTARGMFGVARFLLTPLHNAPPVAMSSGNTQPWHGDHFKAPPNPYIWLCARMEAALSATSKTALLVLPVPFNWDYREAGSVALTTGLLPSLFATLFSVGKIATGQTQQPRMGKTVIAGFSSGGGAAVNAVAANSADTDEVYLFDPKDKGGTAGILSMVTNLTAWAAAGTARRLCIAWGNTNLADAQSCAGQVTTAAPGATVVVAPSVATFYGGSGASPPGDPWWNDSAAPFPAVFTDNSIFSACKHQFVIFGGEDPSWSTGSRVTFFQKFLSGLTP